MTKCPICQSENPSSSTACLACGSPLSAETITMKGVVLPAGTALYNGRYTVGKVLGQGGFGITYLGSDLIDQISIAIKEFFLQGCIRQGTTVRPTGAIPADSYASVKEKFLDEGKVISKFKHPGIVTVKSVFEENNTAYVAMEYLKGRTLKDVIEEKGSIPESEALGYIIKVAEALNEIHKANYLHRDVKPENIILTDDDRVVLIDFGSAREFATGKTKTMTSWLTPGYAPIEQYGQKAKFKPTTDMYALGATAYHILTGKMPEQATDRMIEDTLAPPSDVNPNISKAVSDAVMWAMQIDAANRPQSVSEFLGAVVGKAGALPSTPPSPTIAITPPDRLESDQRKRNLLLPVLLIVVALAITAGLVWMQYMPSVVNEPDEVTTVVPVTGPEVPEVAEIEFVKEGITIDWEGGNLNTYRYTLTPDVCDLHVFGTSDKIDDIDWDTVRVFVDLTGLTSGTHEKEVQFSGLVETVRLDHIIPEKVNVQIWRKFSFVEPDPIDDPIEDDSGDDILPPPPPG